ncbi:transcriptional regulator, GntR family protein [Pseudooceanicola batsensis HTCC2597]|uniref:Transcriptional regulator, GntR family protein n=1 Tax=Pseudooceanicola batsensis (strain ATCC BAA-863 / DSM 15984 / KCTC 12145 / HTCC2597) TaxID=252305 RepID=A3TTK7_PSEBH|nr:GntR family transcriptional regulator [Pseudooceanicola batsensis]EAQ04984.1 transcriptional regulator, GntR family protein [Pseudooceanicola batsensis HTCC2597]
MIFSRGESEDATVVAMLASALRRDISFGVLLPDQKLRINALRQRYGGSNHSMRETLRMLSAEGLVEASAQRGFRVTSATEDDLRDIELVRLEIEKIALARALDAGDTGWEGRVVAAHHALRKAEERVAATPDDLTALEWDERCRAFSASLISACGSPRLIDLQRKFFDQSRRFRLALLREDALDFAARRDRQEALVAAVLARDTDAALAMLERDIVAELRTGR